MTDIAATTSPNLVLNPYGAGGVQEVENWEELAKKQGRITADRLEKASSGAYFAMEDRNTVTLPWRRVYLVRDGDEYIIYDEDGCLLDEPLSGCKGGREPVSELLEYFDETNGFFYRPPAIRRSLVRHRDTQCTARKNKMPAAAVDVDSSDGQVEEHAVETEHCSAAEDNEAAVQQESEAAEEELPGVVVVHEREPLATSGGRQAGSSDAELQLMIECLAESGEGIEMLQSADDASVPPLVELQRVPSAGVPPLEETPNDDDEDSCSAADDPTSESEGSEGTDRRHSAASAPLEESISPPRPHLESSLSQLKDPDVDDGTEYYVGQHVLVLGVAPEYSGVVAVTGENGEMVVAAHSGKWHHLTQREVRSRVHEARAEHMEDDGSIAVRALSRDSCGSAITGMLLGVADEHLFGGQMNSYYAHYAWREENLSSTSSAEKVATRSTSAATASSTAKSFALGDIVTQTNREGGSCATAVVVRVAYKPRIGNAQARRLLLLQEVWDGEDMPPSEGPQLFPASWCNWDRVMIDPSGSDCKFADANTMNHHCMEEVDELHALEQRLSKMKQAPQAQLPKSLRSVLLAVQFAGQNLTPTQIRDAAELAKQAAMQKKAATKETTGRKRAPERAASAPPPPPKRARTVTPAVVQAVPIATAQRVPNQQSKRAQRPNPNAVNARETTSSANEVRTRGQNQKTCAAQNNRVTASDHKPVDLTDGVQVEPQLECAQRTASANVNARERSTRFLPEENNHVPRDGWYSQHGFESAGGGCDGRPPPTPSWYACYGPPSAYGPPPRMGWMAHAPPPLQHHVSPSPYQHHGAYHERYPPHPQWGLPPTPPRVREAAMIARMRAESDMMKANLVEAEYKYTHR